MKKYELIKSDLEGLFRIRALKDFNGVKNGDIGGYVEFEHNLGHEGNCWIYDNAKVIGKAVVSEDARVYGNSVICDYACVCGKAIIDDNSEIHDFAVVNGNAYITDNVKIYDYGSVGKSAVINGNSKILDFSKIEGCANVKNSIICGNAEIYGGARINDVTIKNGRHIGEIEENFKEVLYIQCERRLITVYKDLNDVIKCNIGCQKRMTLEKLLKRIKSHGGMQPYREQYVRIMENAHLLLK